MHYFFFLDTDYRDILTDLAKQWILVEVDHRVSKEATNIFWRIANSMFHRMYMAKGNRGRKIPQFEQLRNKLNQTNTPTVHLDLGYQSKEDGEITVVQGATSNPVSQFPPCTYKRLYEIASVDVRIFIYIYSYRKKYY